MKLLPLLGVDDLRFGDALSKVIGTRGTPTKKSTHPSPEQRTSICYGPLTLGFDGDDRLRFIAVLDSDEKSELWGERPFEIARRSSDAYGELKRWLQAAGRTIQPHQDSFGATLTVPQDGVTFCFVPPDSQGLEGIQLYPR